MALTVTRTGDWQHVAGNRRVANVVVAFDSSYPTGGESLVAADVGMRTIEAVKITPNYGYSFDYDYTNSTIRVYKDQSVGVVTVNSASAPNTTTGSDFALLTYAVPANTFTAGNQGLRATLWGRTASTGGDKILKVSFGGIEYISSTITGSTAWTFREQCEILRGTASAADGIVQLVASTGTTVTSDVEIRLATTADFTSAQNFVFSANTALAGVSANTVTLEGAIIEYIGSPATSSTGAAGLEVAPTTDLSGVTDIRVQVTGY